MNTETSDTPEPLDLDFAGQINVEATCAGCGYSLRGLQATGLCPECSYPIADSIRPKVPRRSSGQRAFTILWTAILFTALVVDLSISALEATEEGVVTTILFAAIWGFLVVSSIIALIVAGVSERATVATWFVLIAGLLLASAAALVHVVLVPVLMPVTVIVAV